MNPIERINPGARLSDMTVYNGVAYLSGQCCDDGSLDVTGQTTQVLAAVDKLLARAGSDRSHVLFAQIFLVDLADFAGMNKAW